MVDSARDDMIDVRELVTRLWRGRIWILGIAILCAIAFAIFAYTKTTTYRARTIAVPASSEGDAMNSGLGSALGQLGGLASMAGINLGGPGAGVEEALAILRSRQFTEAFIERYQLLPILFDRQWDSQNKKWRTENPPPTLTEGYIYFNSQIRGIMHDKKTGLVTITIIWKNREQAAQWANDVIVQLNAEMRRRAIENSSASLAYLEQELSSTTTVGTREAISRLIEAQIKQRMLANVTHEYAFRVVDRALLPHAYADRVGLGKLMLIAVGGCVGGLLGIAIVLIGGYLAPQRFGVRAVGAIPKRPSQEAVP